MQMNNAKVLQKNSLDSHSVILSKKEWDIYLWAVVVMALLIAVLQGLSLSNDIDRLAFMALVFAGDALVLVHGLRRYGWKSLLVFFLFVTFWCMFWENLSIYTGFPFGHYHYDNSFGPKLLEAPYFIGVAYFQLVYMSWNIATVLLRRYTNKISGAWVFVLPIISSFIMTMFDLIVDPYLSTVQGRYVWHDGGAYFGVPFVNYLGWYLCTFTMYISFALYIRWKSRITPTEDYTPSVLHKRSFWLQNIIFFSAWPIQHLIKGFTVDPNIIVTSKDGMTWNLSYLLQTAGIISLSTLFFVILMAFLQVVVLKEVPVGTESSKSV